VTVRQYSTPLAFKQALEQRLRSASATGTDFGRRRQLLVFDRFLARLGRVAGDTVTLKGGLVLELRLERARTTKDVDLRMMGSPADVLELLQEAGRLDLGDHMRFEIQNDGEHPEVQNGGTRFEVYRYRAECRLAAMRYGRPFSVDVGFGDPLTGEPDVTTVQDTHGFTGNAPMAILLVPLGSYVSEKLQALIMCRQRIETNAPGRSQKAPELAPCAGVLLAERHDMSHPMSTDQGAACSILRGESESYDRRSPLIARRRRTPNNPRTIQPAAKASAQAGLVRRLDPMRPGMATSCSDLNRPRAAAPRNPVPRTAPSAALGHQQLRWR